MKPLIARIGLLVLLTLGLTACENSSRTRSPSTRVTVIHAAPSFGALDFRRVERAEATLDYLLSQSFSWDSDTYTFNIDAVSLRAGSPDRVYSFTADLAAGSDYTIVLAEVAGQLQEIVLALPGEPPATDGEFTVVHTASRLGPVDVYLEPPGTDLTAATPRGTLDFLASLAPATLASADYEISLTEVGNPANVLLASATFALPSALRTTFALADGANIGIAPTIVLVSGGGVDIQLVDKNLQSGIRAINAMTGGGALDVAIDSNFSPPLLPGVPFGVPSAYAFFPAGDHNLTVSPAGNPGVIEIDQSFTAAASLLGTWFIAGNPGALTAITLTNDARIIQGEAKLAVYNGVALVPGLDVYVVLPGTDINTVFATAGLLPGAGVSGLRLEIGDYELTVREAGTANVLAGPQTVSISPEGTYSILLTDNAGGTTVDVTLFDDFN